MSFTKIPEAISSVVPPGVVRRYGRRRGTIMIMVVALTVMLSLIGTAYIMTTRIDRVAVKTSESATQFDHIADGAAGAIMEVVVRDLHDQDGNFRPGDWGALQVGNVESSIDYDHFDGIHIWDEQPLRNDNWLASRVPTLLIEQAPEWHTGELYDPGTVVKVTTNLLSRFYRKVSKDATAAPSGGASSNADWAFIAGGLDALIPVWPGVSGAILSPDGRFEDPRGFNSGDSPSYQNDSRNPAYTAARMMFPDFEQHKGQIMPSLRFFNPLKNPSALSGQVDSRWQEAIAADTDGDGIADAPLAKLGVAAVDGLTYYYGVRIIDHGSAINANTARNKMWDLIPDPTTSATPRRNGMGDEFADGHWNGQMGVFRAHVGLEQALEPLDPPNPPTTGGDAGNGEMRMRVYDINRFGMVPDDVELPDLYPVLDEQGNLFDDDGGQHPNAVAQVQGEIMEYNLAPVVRRVREMIGDENGGTGYARDEDGDNVGDRLFNATTSEDESNLGYRFALKTTAPGLSGSEQAHEVADDSQIEQLLFWDLRGRVNDPGVDEEPDDNQPYRADQALTWYNDLFNFSGLPSGSLTSSIAPASAMTARPIRSILTTRNGVTTQTLNHFEYRDEEITEYQPGSAMQGSSYLFGHRVQGVDGKPYIAVRSNDNNSNTLAPQVDPVQTTDPTRYLAAQSYWVQAPWTATPVKANINTAPFEELWLAYLGAIYEGKPWFIFDSERASEFSNPGYTGGWYEDPYVGMRFDREMQIAFIPEGTFLPYHIYNNAFDGAAADAYNTPARHPDRMFRNPIRAVPPVNAARADDVWVPLTTAYADVNVMDTLEVQKLRAALAAVNAVDARDPDVSVTRKTIHLGVGLKARSTVAATGGPTTITGDAASSLDSADDAYTGGTLMFLDGPNRGRGRRITNYDGGTRVFQVESAFPFGISSGEEFRVTKMNSHPVTVFGYEMQPFITEVFVHSVDSAAPDEVDRYLTIELHNPYDVNIDIGNCQLAIINRVRGTMPGFNDFTRYPTFVNDASAAASLDYETDVLMGPQLATALSQTPTVAKVQNFNALEPTVVPAGGYLVIEFLDTGITDRPATTGLPAAGDIPVSAAGRESLENYARYTRSGVGVQSLVDALMNEGREAELVLMAPVDRSFVTQDNTVYYDRINNAAAGPGNLMFPAPTMFPDPPAEVNFYPVDSFDFAGMFEGGTAAVPNVWHYVRPSITLREIESSPAWVGSTPGEKRADARDWRFVYPGRYDASHYLFSRNGTTADPRQQGVGIFNLVTPPTLLSLGRASPVADPTLVDGYYENSFPIPLTSLSLAEPLDPNSIPSPPLSFAYGQFARDGDILHVPYIGRYVIQAPAPDSIGGGGAADEVIEINSISMDAMFAEDTETNNDYWKIPDNNGIDPLDALNSYPDAPHQQRESVGRFTPMVEDLERGYFGVTASASTGTSTTVEVRRTNEPDGFFNGYTVQLTDVGNLEVIYRTVESYDADAAPPIAHLEISGQLGANIPAGSPYQLWRRTYHWSHKLFDFVGVTTPHDDVMPGTDPQLAFADPAWRVPHTIKNRSGDKNFPARVYGRVLSGSSSSVFYAYPTLPRDLKPDLKNFSTRIVFFTQLQDYMVAHAAPNEPRSVIGYTFEDNGTAEDPNDDRVRIEVTPGFSATPGAEDTFVIYGDAEDTVGVEGLININTAPWHVIAKLPLIPWQLVNDAWEFPDADDNNVDDNLQLALAIVQHRSIHGPFRSIMELNNVYSTDDLRAILAPNGSPWIIGDYTDVSDRILRPINPFHDTVTGVPASNRHLWQTRPADPQMELMPPRRGFRNAWGNLANTPLVPNDEWAFDPDDDWGDITPRGRENTAAQGVFGEGRDNLYNSYEENFLTLTRISNLITLRSDVYTVYLQIQAWRDAGTPEAELVNQRRVAYIVDRSSVTRDPSSRAELVPVPVD